MIELQNVCYVSNRDGDNKEIIKNISLKIDERFVVITGPNGGGKSTLSKLIMGLYKPTSGRILFNGTDITNMSVTDRANLGIGYAFQQPVKFKGLTVGDLIQIASGKNISVAECCEFLSEVGLCAKEYINRELNNSLSGGELKRIEIAVSLARGSKLSIFDEPEAGIDLWSFNSLIAVFEKMYKQTQGTILIVSHQERILNIADRVIVLEKGQVKYDGSKDDVLPKLFTSSSCSALSKNSQEVK